jgi:hypothetical protein
LTAWSIVVYGQSQTPADYAPHARKADSLLKAKAYKEAALSYSAAFKTNGWKGAPEDRYNAARAWALAGVPDSAFFALNRLVTRVAFHDHERVEREKDFTLLHSDKRWATLLADIKANKLPYGWGRAGSHPYSYLMFIDAGAGKEGKNAASIQSIVTDINGFGTLMQTIKADNYKGKRVRMSGFLKTKDVEQWAGLWLRVDNADLSKTLAFDNMKDGKTDRAVRGTTDWQRYNIVLDVPAEADVMSFGALLDGTGQVWFDDLKFETVEETVPTTGKPPQRETEPVNLNFENR